MSTTTLTPEGVRAELVKAMEADLIGPFVPDGHPGAGEEVLPLAPSRWYLTGFLAPQAGRMPDADDEDSEDGLEAGTESKAEDAGNADPEPKRRQHFPASLGLSAFLPPGPTDGSEHVEVTISWADYAPEEISEDRAEKTKKGWKRVPRGPYTVQVPLDDVALSRQQGVRWPESTGLCFRGELRTTDMEGLEPGTRVLSLFLVNDRVAIERDRDINFAFQVQGDLHARPDAGPDSGRCTRALRHGMLEKAVRRNKSEDRFSTVEQFPSVIEHELATCVPPPPRQKTLWDHALARGW